MKLLADGRKFVSYLKRNGLKDAFYAAAERLNQRKNEKYQYMEPTEEILDIQRKREWDFALTFSIVVPAFRTPEKYLREMMGSVLGQTYGNLELLIGDATEDRSVEKVVNEIAQADSKLTGKERVKYLRLKENGGISANTNSILAKARGDYVGLLDHDDVLAPDALYEMALWIEKGKKDGNKPWMLYSDEDKWDGEGKYYEPNFKPDFNLDLLLSNNYICHFLVMERELIQDLGFRAKYDGAQDYDLALRAAERLFPQGKGIVHVPGVLYHWRCHPGSTAENPESKSYAYEAGRRALQDFADRMGWKAEAIPKKHEGFYGLAYPTGILAARPDVGAVGGRLLRKGKRGLWRVCGGAIAMDKTREGGARILFYGLLDGFSGYMHRAVLTQDADAVDIRCLRLAQGCSSVFQKITGVPYVEIPGEMRFDDSTLPEDADIIALSAELGKALREAGFLVCWDPGWTRRL